jgi:microcystin-dependent protein
MADPFVAEIRIFPFNFAPTGWAFCNGQLLPISQNTALFSLVGTYYGGDGKSTFGLPNLKGSFPMYWGQGPGLSLYDLGQVGGAETVSLLASEIPQHTHALSGGTNAPQRGAAGTVPGASPAKPYHPGPPNATANPAMVGPAGGGAPHNNMPPYLTLSFCIAMQGVFPPRS